MSGYKGFSVSGGVEEVYVNSQKAFFITLINQYEICYALKNLKAKGILSRTGLRKNGSWTIIDS